MKKEGKKKNEWRKPKYGLFSAVKYSYSLLWKYNKVLTFVGVFTIPLSLILTAIGLYTPSIVLRALESYKVFSTVALIISGLILSELLFKIINNFVGTKIRYSENVIFYRLWYIIKEKEIDDDFYLQYSNDYQTLRLRAKPQNNHTAGVHFPMDFSDMVSTVLRFILFGAVVSFLHPLIIVLLIFCSLVNSLALRWERQREFETRDERNEADLKTNYITYSVGYSDCGKDIRLYGMRDFIDALAKKAIGQRASNYAKLEGRSFIVSLISFIMIIVRDGAAYAFLIFQAAKGDIDAASFVLYFNAITALSGVMGDILGKINRIAQGARATSDFMVYLETVGRHNRGAGIPLPKGAFSIEFRNVSFKYPQGDKNVLENISFRIEAGEKVAIVGLNGAGKTTVALLMCGLLLPDSGQVLLDGKDILLYNRDEMYSLFGAVTQYFCILPLSIERNITLRCEDEEVDYQRLDECIEYAGLSKKIASLPKGIETPLNRKLYDDAVELSGGETQRLLLARALYRECQCLILDEPTAALDPLAEDEMYRKYSEISAGKTSIFISHRLASTRFCDRILFLDGAKFAEEGTHEELMARGGKYRELFDVQSKYYKEGEENENENEKEEVLA